MNERERKVEAIFAKYVAGKRCVVVGPAGYMRGEGRGAELDAFDVVVKLNWGETLPVEDFGRTDVLYKRLLKLGHADEVLVESYIAAGIRYVIGVGTRRDPDALDYLERTIGERLPWYIDRPTRHALRHRLGSSPLLGLVAVTHLLDRRAAAVHVAGCDFYESGYAQEYGGTRYRKWMGRPEGVMSIKHDKPSQLRYLAELKAREPRLTFDPELSKLTAPFAPRTLPRRKRRKVAAA